MTQEQKRKLWSWIVQTVISALTALATAFGMTSCIA